MPGFAVDTCSASVPGSLWRPAHIFYVVVNLDPEVDTCLALRCKESVRSKGFSCLICVVNSDPVADSGPALLRKW